MKTEAIGRVLQAIETLRAGGMVILVDDEDRENEGDLVMVAEKATPVAVNFMACHARGLICLSMTEDRVKSLDIPMMVHDNASTRGTAFTVSIEARSGVTTGISAADRAQTIRVAVDPKTTPHDLVRPGHVFPLRARPGGVLQRSGHTEGSVDLARLAGCEPASVICEIMKDDGTMARQKDLAEFGAKHGLLLLSIADIIEYRLQTETIVERIRSEEVVLPTGSTWQAHIYRSSAEEREFLALVYGAVDSSPTTVRVHSGNVLGDIVGIRRPSRVSMRDAVEHIEADGKGVVLFIPRKHDLHADLDLYTRQLKQAAPTPPAADTLREFGIGAQVLVDLGLHEIRLLTNHPRRIAGLEGFGLEVIEQVLLERPQGSTRESAASTTH